MRISQGNFYYAEREEAMVEAMRLSEALLIAPWQYAQAWDNTFFEQDTNATDSLLANITAADSMMFLGASEF